ncbi:MULTISPECIES: hypothetical protein [Marinomonas]|uniref:NAD(P)-dependent oxidoreductase n=1 Tax=Marinomonas arctica TaxID=383750 RepID=A0A7H1J457_9GAMM|nr:MULTISPECIES: hypothetical protein [Marinomonas]QNT05273.1 hypothetical protein IBG28_16535 [Marinomonas arctica]
MMIFSKKILITGASGWFGKSFILSYVARFSEKALSNLILVTSDGRDISIPGIDVALKTISLKCINNIDGVDVVIQAAFLTRDKISEYGDQNYKAINLNIIDTVSNYVRINRVTSVFLISSGAVNDSGNKKDLYSELKKSEEDAFLKVCNPLIFRVYGATGKLTPKVSWSALSEFICKGKCDEDISLKSKGRVLRSYVSFDVLSELIMECISRGGIETKIIDACSFSIDIFTLATNVAKIFDIKVEKNKDYDETCIVDSYIGSNKEFISFCEEHNIYLPTLEELVSIASKSPFL